MDGFRKTVSIRVVVLGVALAVTVLLGAVGTVLIHQTQHRISEASESTMAGYARLVALAHSQWIDESESVLAAVATAVGRSDMKNDECTAKLAEILTRARTYDIFLIASPDGDVWCAPQPMVRKISLSDRQYFKQAVASKRFTAGEYLVGRISGQRVLPVAYPVLRQDGQPEFVVIGGKQVSWFEEVVATLDLPTDTHVTIIDGNGVMLAHYPDSASDEEVPPGVLMWGAEAAKARENSLFVGIGHGGVERIHAYSPLTATVGAGAIISLPTSRALAPVHAFLVQATIALGAGLVLSILLVLALLKGAILNPMSRLLDGIRAVAAGDRSWRTKGHAGGSSEMAELYISFDRMMGELQEQEARIREQASELERSNTDLQNFAYTVSHDLREPLRTVGSFIRLIERRYADKLDDEGREFMNYVTDGAERMSRMLDGILEFSRVQTRGQAPVPINLDEALDLAVQALGFAISESGARIERTPLPKVVGDQEQLARVFQNLISNSIKFRRPDVPLAIAIAAERKGDVWEISVADNGCGLPADGRDQLFVLFRRLVTRDKVPGEGVGLAICRRIVERHGGTIRVVSEPDQGATFLFTLPVLE